jgi:hypothetical protein
MKITIESTSKVAQLYLDSGNVPARVWIGTTDKGVPVHCYVTRVTLAKENPSEEEAADFERDLQPTEPPRPAPAELDYIPLRMIL